MPLLPHGVGDGVTASVGVRDRLAVAVAGTGVALDNAVAVEVTPGVFVDCRVGMLAVSVAVGCG
jgi:hypothetical protein